MNKLKTNNDMENYETLKLKHLQRSSCIIDGIDCNGILFVEEDNIFLLQNNKNGKIKPKNEDYKKYGYNLTWLIIQNKKITKLVQSIKLK